MWTSIAIVPFLLPTTVPPMFYSEIVAAAELIVTATVAQTEARVEAKSIRTYVTLDDLLVHKGEAERLVLRFEGGTVGRRTLHVPSMPRLKAGVRYLLFVARNGENLSPIVGFHQGAFELVERDDRTLLRNLAGDELVGVRDDRFVFATRQAARSDSRIPAIGGVDRSYRPARGEDPEVSSRPSSTVAELPGRAVPAARTAAPPPKLGSRPSRRDASPIRLPATADPGTRWSPDHLLAGFR